jgi:hypothetical protein
MGSPRQETLLNQEQIMTIPRWEGAILVKK